MLAAAGRGRALAQRRGRAVPVGEGLGSRGGGARDAGGAQEHDREGGAERHAAAVRALVHETWVPTEWHRKLYRREGCPNEGAPGGGGRPDIPG